MMDRKRENSAYLDTVREQIRFNNSLKDSLKSYSIVSKKLYESTSLYSIKLGKALVDLNIKHNKSFKSLVDASRVLVNNFAKVVLSDYTKDIVSFLVTIAENYDKAIKNPNSVFNFQEYESRLDEFHWAWPYGVDRSTLLTIIKDVHCERDFDSVMLNHFSEERIHEMIEEAKSEVDEHHIILLDQIENGIQYECYALVNNSLMSIIDNSLSVYLFNKGNTNRKGMFNPIIHYHNEWPLSEVSAFVYELMILSNNIDFIFNDYSLNEDVELETNKEARRHLSVHGFRYSNKRIDTIMLLNSLLAIIRIKPYLKNFEGSLIRKNKKFIFSEESITRLFNRHTEVVINRLIRKNGSVTHSQLLLQFKELKVLNNSKIDMGKEISKTLQKMKRQGIIIYTKDDEGRKCWKATSDKESM